MQTAPGEMEGQWRESEADDAREGPHLHAADYRTGIGESMHAYQAECERAQAQDAPPALLKSSSSVAVQRVEAYGSCTPPASAEAAPGGGGATAAGASTSGEGSSWLC